jgi:sugar transferase (PEP-CTERM/EpsH1 system associated)
MANLLYLAHRMPYPPNKGDKVRSYHLLQHLAAKHRVFVGTFVDDPDDEQHLDTLRGMCAGLCAVRLHSRRARVASLAGLLIGQALTLQYYRNSSLERWVADTVTHEHIDASIVFSSSMAQYAIAHPQLPMLVDFVDVDSAKWTDYAPNHRWPLSWLYAREGRRLLAYEREVASMARRSFFATAKEAELFCGLAPECRDGVEGMSNGVDANYFAPAPARESPFRPDETPLVFTGAMDYWPNVDAVTWFASAVLPRLRESRPGLRFHIVGRSPTAAVRALASDAVSVTGTVPDVRPYLQHAAVVVAPLRLARGIQNKVLEAMAMARPVVAASACVDALTAQAGSEILAAAEADDYRQAIDRLLDEPQRASAIGHAGRNRVLATYSWPAHLQQIDRHIAAAVATPTAAHDLGLAPPTGLAS